MSTRGLPSQEYLKECFKYDFETGKLYWKERPRCHFPTENGWKIVNARQSGKEAGSLNITNGYLNINLSTVIIKVHRIIWKLVYGEDPDQIDHINGERADNRIENLRCVNKQENNKNSKKRIDNSSGVTGVNWHKKHMKWNARINLNGVRKELGLFVNKNDAIAARKAAEIKYGFHENHGREK